MCLYPFDLTLSLWGQMGNLFSLYTLLAVHTQRPSLTVAQGLYQWACLHTAMRRHQSLWHCLLVYRAPILSWVVCGIPLGYGIQELWIINSDLTYFTVIIRQTHDLRGASGRWNRFDQLVNLVGLYFLFLPPPPHALISSIWLHLQPSRVSLAGTVWPNKN